jgi:hypothetical protein
MKAGVATFIDGSDLRPGLTMKPVPEPAGWALRLASVAVVARTLRRGHRTLAQVSGRTAAAWTGAASTAGR